MTGSRNGVGRRGRTWALTAIGAAIALTATAPGWAQPRVPASPATAASSTAKGNQSAPGPVWVVSDLGRAANPRQHRDLDDIVSLTALSLMKDRLLVAGVTVDGHPANACGSGPSVASAWGAYSGRLRVAATCGTRFDAKSTSRHAGPGPIRAMRRELAKGPLTVLNWGPMTEVATLVSQLEADGDTTALSNLRVITHWTSPSRAYNCATDARACSFVHDRARSGRLDLVEIGDGGQRGLVDNSCHSKTALPTDLGRSAAGRGLTAKWKGDWPDMSDASTVFVALGFAGTARSNGSAPVPGLGDLLCAARPQIAQALIGAAKR